jgi:hypothetical protein
MYAFLGPFEPYLKFTMLFYILLRPKTGRQLKRYMQWNMIGILALGIGLSLGTTLLYESAVFKIGEFSVYLENSFLIVFSITSSLMCFVFGLFYGLSQQFR